MSITTFQIFMLLRFQFFLTSATKFFLKSISNTNESFPLFISCSKSLTLVYILYFYHILIQISTFQVFHMQLVATVLNCADLQWSPPKSVAFDSSQGFEKKIKTNVYIYFISSFKNCSRDIFCIYRHTVAFSPSHIQVLTYYTYSFYLAFFPLV